MGMTSPHATHDELLIAAGLDDDLSPADAQRLADLLASCSECAALDADLRSIRSEVAALPAPARPRSFRLTPEQAGLHAPAPAPAPVRRPEPVAPRGSWLDRFRFARPVGVALATMGLVGILVGSVPGLTGGTALTTVGLPSSAGAERDSTTTNSNKGSSDYAAGTPQAPAITGGDTAHQLTPVPGSNTPPSAEPSSGQAGGGVNLPLIGGSVIVGAAGVVLVVRRRRVVT